MIVEASIKSFLALLEAEPADIRNPESTWEVYRNALDINKNGAEFLEEWKKMGEDEKVQLAFEFIKEIEICST